MRHRDAKRYLILKRKLKSAQRRYERAIELLNVAERERNRLCGQINTIARRYSNPNDLWRSYSDGAAPHGKRDRGAHKGRRAK